MTESAELQRRRLRRLTLMVKAENLRLVRCDGTREDLAHYQARTDHDGWRLAAPPRVGDLLVSTVGAGRARVVVSVCRVEEVQAANAFWDPVTDVRLVPPIAWTSLPGSTLFARSKGA